eukprot:5211474-Pleurochrysis_carterae.AAC.1
MHGPGILGQDQRPDPRSQPLHPGPLCRRKAKPPHQQVPADRTGGSSTPTRNDRQEAAGQREP